MCEGKTALPTETITDLLRRYDQQIAIGITSFPIRPHESGHKGRTPPPTYSFDCVISKSKFGDSSSIGVSLSITTPPNA